MQQFVERAVERSVNYSIKNISKIGKGVRYLHRTPFLLRT